MSPSLSMPLSLFVRLRRYSDALIAIIAVLRGFFTLPVPFRWKRIKGNVIVAHKYRITNVFLVP